MGGLTIVRFEPDSFLETLLRPLAMAAPHANVYVELMAPDFRFIFVIGLLILLAAMFLLRARRDAHADGPGAMSRAWPVVVLLLVLAVTFVAWLETTANGRYFVLGLLIVGPVCVGLTKLLPVTKQLRLTLAVLMLAIQGFAVHQSDPFRAWPLTSWTEAPYFHLEVPPQSRTEPATYVTLSAISYSLVAPLFHPQSRWMSLHNAPAPRSGGFDAARTEAFLSKAQPGRLMLFAPVVPGMQTSDNLPVAEVYTAVEQQLAPYRLRFSEPRSCQFLPSRGLAGIGLGQKTEQERGRTGFWMCHLTRMTSDAAPASRAIRHGSVFRALEAQCPRFFPAGGDGAVVALATGEMRSYLQSEMKAYVYDSGEVYYKYYRALNPVLIGKVEDLLTGRSRVDCGKIRGRSGLPWEHEI